MKEMGRAKILFIRKPECYKLRELSSKYINKKKKKLKKRNLEGNNMQSAKLKQIISIRKKWFQEWSAIADVETSHLDTCLMPSLK